MTATSRMLTIVIIMHATSIARAATTAWYTTPYNFGTWGGPAGGEGQVLDLYCETGLPSPCDYTVTMHINGDDNVGLIAWASDLHSTSFANSVTGAVIAPGNPFNSLAQAGTGGSGLNLLTGSQGQQFGAPVTGSVQLITFTLHHSFVFGGSGFSLITETAGSGATGVVWAGGDGDYAIVSFAGGPAQPHPELSPGGLVIRIIEICPEPATLSMLGLGALGIGRRRRRVACRFSSGEAI